MRRTGHRSNATRSYKRPSNTLVKSGSNALQPPTVLEPGGKKQKVGKNTEENKVKNEIAGSSRFACLFERVQDTAIFLTIMFWTIFAVNNFVPKVIKSILTRL